jgi:hypothetical protein
MMKHFKKVILPVMLALTLSLSVVAVSSRQFAIEAAGSDIDIEGIVGQFTLDEQTFAAVIYEINHATGEAIDSNIEKVEEKNYASGEVTDVANRDWNTYSSSTACANFSDSEKAFWNRLEQLSQYYMDNSTIDAYYVSAYSTYAINGVKYSDIGLTSQQAFYVAEWFLYNNPQYYFLKPTFLTTNTAVYIGCYDVAADGDDRAELTNEIFDEIDYIAEYVASVSTSEYEQEQYLHDVVCGNVDYVAGTYDQSIYSAIGLGETVCAGYAGLMNVLLNSSGIDTITTLSTVHAWNEVYLDGEWYGLDATWDDSLGDYTFFDVCDANLKKYDSTKSNEHTVETAWVAWTPELSMHDYGDAGNDEKPEVSLDTPVVSAERIDASTGRITWNIVPGATSYEVGIYSDNTYSARLLTKNTKNYSMKFTNMESDAVYYFTVRAVKETDSDTYYSDYVYGMYSNSEQNSVQDNTQDDKQDNGQDNGQDNKEQTDADNGTENSAENDTEPETPSVTQPAYIDTSDVAETSVRLVWGASNDADKYEIEVYKDANYTTKLVSGSTAKTSIKLTGLKSGQTVYIRIRSVADIGGSTYYSDYVYAQVSTLSDEKNEVNDNAGIQNQESQASSGQQPSDSENRNESQNQPEQNTQDEQKYEEQSSETVVGMPAEFSAENVTKNSCSLVWEKVSGASYEIQISYDSDFSRILAKGSTSKLKMNVKGLNPGTDYYARIRSAVSRDGSISYSAWSDLSFTTESDAPIQTTVTVDVPSGFAASDIDTSSAKLSWNLVDGAAYEIQIANDADFAKMLAKGSTSKLKMNVKGLKENCDYYARVRAVKTSNGQTYYSDWTSVSFKTDGNGTFITKPSITVSDVDSSSSRIQWNNVSNTADYELCIYSDSARTRMIASKTTSKTSLKLSGIKKGMTYYVSVRAVDTVNGIKYYSDWAEAQFTK